MEVGSFYILCLSLFIGFIGVGYRLLRRINYWLYEEKLGDKRFSLPPGDLGWPYIGNMWSFLRAFKSGNPDSFMNGFAARFGRVGLYKAVMFGRPSVIVTTPETCRRVLTDDASFKPGWPYATYKLVGENSFVSLSPEEHKRLRRVTAAPMNGHEALSTYLKYIEENFVKGLEKWAGMEEIEFLGELRKVTFKIIMHIFLSSEGDQVTGALEKEYNTLNYGIRAMAINIPGFAFHRSLKARKNLVAIFQSIVNKRRAQAKENPITEKKDMMDMLLNIEDENGRKLEDEEIIDLLLMYLNAGHESSSHMCMWATLILQNHPHVLEKAKAEQEAVLKTRPPEQNGLTLKEIRKMDYLNKVIDELLRLVTFSFVVFREANKDVSINGYLIPKGWRVLIWFRGVHLDSEVYQDPRKFDPSRWDNMTAKAGTFLPFGGGAHLCPGNDLAKLEIAIYLHYFLLYYKFERKNPTCPIIYLPHQRPKDNCLGRIIRNPNPKASESTASIT